MGPRSWRSQRALGPAILRGPGLARDPVNCWPSAKGTTDVSRPEATSSTCFWRARKRLCAPARHGTLANHPTARRVSLKLGLAQSGFGGVRSRLQGAVCSLRVAPMQSAPGAARLGYRGTTHPPASNSPGARPAFRPAAVLCWWPRDRLSKGHRAESGIYPARFWTRLEDESPSCMAA